MNKNALRDAICVAIRDAMDSTSDQIVRLTAPRDWPVVEAVKAYSKESSNRLRVLVARPFRLKDFAPVQATENAGLVTTWRNKPRKFPILVVGGKDGSLMAGLDDINQVPRDSVYEKWRSSVLAVLPTDNDLGKPEVRRLLNEIFTHAKDGRIAASCVERFLRKVFTEGTVTSVQQSLAELGLLRDTQILDDGMAATRLQRNLDVVDLLRSADEQRLDTRLKEVARSARTAIKRAAKAALLFRQAGDSSGIVETDLVDMEACLAKAPPAPTARTIGLSDLLDLYCENREAVTECLRDLSASWRHDEVVDAVESEVALPTGTLRVSVPLTPTTEEVARDDEGEDGEECGEDDEEQLSFQWIGDGVDDDVLAALSKATKPESIAAGQTYMSGQVLLRLAERGQPVQRYLEARRNLRDLEPWLERDSVAVVLLWPEAISRLQEFVDAWIALAQSALNEDVDPSFVEVVQALETVSGPDESPSWIVLGPLHPFRLDPLVRAGQLALDRLNSPPEVPSLGAALDWTLDKSYPAYPTIHRGVETYFNSCAAPLVVYDLKPTSYLPLAREYRGLDRTLRSLEAYSPPLRSGLNVLVIDPPSGGAVCKALDTAKRRVASRPLTVHHLSTCDDSDNLEDYGGEVRYMPKVLALSDATSIPSVNVLLRFLPGPSSESEATAADWGATRGTHLALQLAQSVSNLFGATKRPHISIDPRQGNKVVRVTHDLYAKASGKKPKVATLRPLFDPGEAPVLSRMAARTDWLVFAAPGPLGLVNPKTINNTLRFVGRHNCGRYGLYVYAADDMFAVRKHFETFFKVTPIATMQPSQMVDLLVSKAHESGNAVLFAAANGAEAQVASIVALAIAKEHVAVTDHAFVLSLDDLGWAEKWLAKRRRADFVLVLVTSAGEIELRVVESKSNSAGSQVTVDPGVDPCREAIEQVVSTMHCLEEVCNAAEPNLDQDLRFTSLIEHLMAAVMASLDGSSDDRTRDVIDAVNRFSRRESGVVRITGRAIVTQSKVNAPRISKDVTAGVSLIWAGAPDVAKAFDVPQHQPAERSARREANEGAAESSMAAGKAAQMVNNERESKDSRLQDAGDAIGLVVAGQSSGEGAIDAPAIGRNDDVGRDNTTEIAVAFIQACKTHGIPVVGMSPTYVHAGPTLLTIGVRFREGATIRGLEARSADIARDIGLGDRAHAITVLNDSEPSTVKVLLPRSDRFFPLLPSSAQPDLLTQSGDYLPVSIGQTIDGRDYQASVESWPHLLVAGSSGSGKTTFIKTILKQCAGFGPGYVQTIVVDGKGEADYFGILPPGMFPPRFANIQLGAQLAVPVLEYVVEEMEQRRQAIISMPEASSQEGGVKATELFCNAIQQMRMPPIVPLVVVIDEFAEIMLANKRSADQFESLVQRVAQVGRSRLIHLVLATQRPDKETIRGAIKANFTTRAIFRLPTSADSVAAMGYAGAEKLLPYGDMWFDHGGSGRKRLQGYRL